MPNSCEFGYGQAHKQAACGYGQGGKRVGTPAKRTSGVLAIAKTLDARNTGNVIKRCVAAWLVLMLALMVAPGCNKQIFLSERIFEDATNQLSYQLENNSSVGVEPTTPPVQAPAIVDYPDRPAQFMTLQEAIAIALENGKVSFGSGLFNNPLGGGLVDDTMIALGQGPLNGQSDRIRVLALDPAIAHTNIEASLSRFDTKWITTMGWSNTDNLVNGLSDFQNGQAANFSSTLAKFFPSGGVANVSLGTNNPIGTNSTTGAAFNGTYTMLRNPPAGVINNIYNMPLTVGIEQPLWQSFGVGINQLLNQVAPIQGITMPGQAVAYLNNNSRLPLSQSTFSGLQTQGILVARLTFDLRRAEFERSVNILLANTEVGYWNLYKAYGQLFSWDEALRSALTGWRTAKANFDADRGKPQDVSLTRALYEEFRGERLKALGQVLEAERNLRGILGLASEDGTRIVPVTAPTIAPYQPNWQAAVDDAIALRPELVMARENLRNLQFNLMIAKNFLKPDLRAVAFYQPVGFGTTLTGNGTLTDGLGVPRTDNALKSLWQNEFNNWAVGLTLNVPLGWRLEHAAVRSARLQLAQSYYLLQDQEERAKRYLTGQYQKINQFYRQIEIARQERKSYEATVRIYWKLIAAGFENFTPGNQAVVDAERRLALSRLKEFEAIAEYNSTLCRFELAKGTIQQHDNITISEGPLPQAVQVRAVENERMKTRAFVMQERAQPITQPTEQPGMLFERSRDVPDNLEGAILPGPRGFDDGAPLKPEAIPVPPKELKVPEKLDPKLEGNKVPEGAAIPAVASQGTVIIPESDVKNLPFAPIPEQETIIVEPHLSTPPAVPATPRQIGPPPLLPWQNQLPRNQ